jgi:carnosine N-methyltransferase
LSQELDGCEDSNLDCAPHERYTLDERHDSSCQPALTNSCTYKEESKHIRDPITGVSIEELQRKEAHDHSPKDDSADTRINDKTCDCHEGQLNHDHGSVMPTHILLYLSSAQKTFLTMLALRRFFSYCIS